MDYYENKFRQNNYSRANAVNYARTYALKPNPAYRYFPLQGEASGDCANFISQCLRAGGAPFSFNPRNPWWYKRKNINNDTWSISWSVAHSLYWYLKINNELKLPGLKGIEVNSTQTLELGDLIFYQDTKGVIFHSAIITGFNKIPLVSHHSYEALNIPYINSYKANKNRFIKISF
jgi:hypothetical protein